jgi:hypothetical protein
MVFQYNVADIEPEQEEPDCASCYPDDCEKCQLITKIHNEECSRHEKELRDLNFALNSLGRRFPEVENELRDIWIRVFGGN